MICQDKFEATKLQKMKTDATQELESCVNRSIDDSIRVLPHVVEQIKSTLVHRYTRLITASSTSSLVSLRALLPIHARTIVLGVIRQPGLSHQPPRRRGSRLPRLHMQGVRRRACT